MRKKRELIEGAFYHVTSRTNDKIRVFESNVGRRIMILTLEEAKENHHFRLANFCIMPNHIHLLIQPRENSCLSTIMHSIKLRSAKRWNNIHGSTDHMWGQPYFSRIIKDPADYYTVMDYIDNNPVAAGLVENPADWKASGAYYIMHDIPNLVDFIPTDRFRYIKLLT